MFCQSMKIWRIWPEIYLNKPLMMKGGGICGSIVILSFRMRLNVFFVKILMQMTLE